jgi:hypothetical protein
MKKYFVILSLVLLTASYGHADSCISVGSDLALNMCAVYKNTQYGFVLKFYPNSADTSGAYWKMDTSTFKQLSDNSRSCQILDSDLSLDICAEFQGAKYSFKMDFFPNPYDSAGLYWKADKTTFTANPDDVWKYNFGTINLGTTITYSGSGISVSGTTVNITAGGDYTLTGTLTNGMIRVDTTEKVKLRLSNVNITNKSGSAIFISNADKAFITIVEDTVNYLTDGSSYSSSIDAKGTIFSNDSLEIKGDGTLHITGNYNHAIACDDGIRIENGNIIIEKALSDGIHANNTVTVDGGNITISSSSDGIESEEDIVVNDGIITVSAGGDGIIAETSLTVNGGTIDIVKASEGIESKGNIVINDGYITVAAKDDGLNAGKNITINGGDIYSVSTAGDALDSSGTLNINGGIIVASGANAPEGGADCDNSTFTIKGGILVAIGGSNSTPTASTSTQPSVLLGSATANSIVRIEQNGTEVLTFKTSKAYANMLFTSPNLALGKTYTVYTGGSVSGGTNFYGLYTGAGYSGGTQSRTFTTTSVVTNAGGTTGGRF